MLNGLADPPAPAARPRDDELTMAQLLALGTHNSYHLASEFAVPGDEWGYSHAPIAVQLAEQGVRQLELDVFLEPDGTHRVLHAPVVDEQTSCATLSECLAPVAEFSDAHPDHHPIFVFIEPKEPAVHAPRLEETEARVESVPGPDRLIRPDEVRRGFTTLRDAVTVLGWPTLGETRGRVLVALLRDAATEKAYLEGRPNLEGRAFFMLASVEDDHAAVLKMDDPESDIESVVAQGFIVRTRADHGPPLSAERAARAFASGAQIVSTDYPAPVDWTPYVATIEAGAPSTCNPITAPPGCLSTDIEKIPL